MNDSSDKKKDGLDTVLYYNIYESGMGGTRLLEDDDAYKVINKIKEYVDETEECGRLQVPHAEIGLVASLEGQHEHYGEDEIEENIRNSKILHFQSSNNYVFVQEPFLACLEQQGITEFRAYPIKYSHKATGREWPDFWYVLYTYPEFRKELLQDDRRKIFVSERLEFRTYYNGEMKAALQKTVNEHGWPGIEFVERELKCCRPVPLEDSAEGDRMLLELLETLFRNKQPKFRSGERYWDWYFVGRLLETYSNVDFDRVAKAIDRDQSGKFFYERGEEEGDSSWLGMND